MTQDDRIWFFLHTKAGKFLVKAAMALAPAVGALLTLMLLYIGETKLFPVIVDFHITRFDKVENQYVLEGSFRKTRPCDLIATNVLADPKIPLAPNILVYQFRDETMFGGDAPVGVSTWGPVNLAMPPELAKRINEVHGLEIRGTHRCHGFWNQETSYGYIPIERIPQ